MPALVLIVMGTIELGMILFTYSAAGSASRDVARRIATNRLASTSAATTVTQQMPHWVQSHTTVTVAQTTPSTPATNQITINVSFPVNKATPTNFLAMVYGTSTLQMATTMQQEPL